MDDSQEEEGLIPDKGMHRIFETKELDYLTHIVMRMYENTAVSGISCCVILDNLGYMFSVHIVFICQVSLTDPKRFRIELLFSCGAAVNPLEVTKKCSVLSTFMKSRKGHKAYFSCISLHLQASPRDQDHTMPVFPPETLQGDSPPTYLLETDKVC